MGLIKYITNPHDRIAATHFLVIFILVVNIIFFTENSYSLLIQITLIIAVIIHNRDDTLLKDVLMNTQIQLKEDSNIFDRNVIVSESDLDGIITYVNPKFCEISGYTKEELIGQPHSIVRDPQTPSDFFKNLWNTIESGETFYGVLRNLRKNGSYYWIDMSITPIMKNGSINGYKAIRFDITDQVAAKEGLKNEISKHEDLLKLQNSRFEFAINSSRDGFWDYDVAKQEFYLSSGWKKRLGFEKDEVVTYLKYLELIPDEYRFEHHKAMHDILDDYPLNDLEYVHFRIRYTLITKSGEKILIEDVGDAFFDNEQTPTRITGFHRDITEQERQAKMIESQNRVAAMGEMIGNIAHQWRQPIGAINNALNDLEFDIELEEIEKIPAIEYLKVSKKVKEYTAHLSQTIDDFRSISSDEKVKSNFFISDVLDTAYSIIATEYKESGIYFTSTRAGQFQCELTGYKRELMQVIINILNNAKDVLVEKKITNPQVIISFFKDSDKNIVISIYDNAGGVPDSIKEKIFDPYFTTKHESVGTGIGLYMSKKIITQHFNGSLYVENENGGAKFVISIPIA
ncbi:MAG: PAS domain-containing sensor histidine kinase [Campylobacterota bacterium]|nr:PAS domain-containing sensor histidine kinase [Campylobacterota bacterium]